jgi:hypothetical protein
MIPLMAVTLVVVLHWGQFLALFGLGEEHARLNFEWKSDPLPVTYIATILIAALVLELLPYLEELWRGVRAKSASLR